VGRIQAGEGRVEVGEDQSADRDEEHRQDRHCWVGHRVDVAGEQNPELAAEHDAERYPEGESDGRDNRRLPGHRGGQLPLGEAERLQQGQIPAAADRRGERQAPRDAFVM
jgi:hypothetical protein